MANQLTKIINGTISLVGIFGAAGFYSGLQLFTVPLWFCNPKLAYELNSWLVKSVWKVMHWFFEERSGAQISFSGDTIEEGDSALIIANHNSWVDFYLAQSIAKNVNMLAYVRYFAKASLKWVPFFGTGMYLAGFLMIKRNWVKDSRLIDSTVERINKYKLPILIVNFIEGTRLNQEKLLESQAFCTERNHTVLQHVLFPRTKGIMTCINKFRDTHVKYLYDLTICYLNTKGELVPAPSIVEVHSQSIKNEYKFHIHVRKFLLKDLPDSDPELVKFLIKLQEEKDLILSQFCKVKDHEHPKLPDNLKIELPNKSD